MAHHLQTSVVLRGLAMYEYTKATPPGWKEYIHGYPLKLYLEELWLWIRTTDVPPDNIGPIAVGRLKGAAYRMVLKMRILRQNGTTLFTDEALATRAEILFPASPSVGLFRTIPATPSGLDMLIQILEESFGELEYDAEGATWIASSFSTEAVALSMITVQPPESDVRQRRARSWTSTTSQNSYLPGSCRTDF